MEEARVDVDSEETYSDSESPLYAQKDVAKAEQQFASSPVLSANNTKQSV